MYGEHRRQIVILPIPKRSESMTEVILFFSQGDAFDQNLLRKRKTGLFLMLHAQTHPCQKVISTSAFQYHPEPPLSLLATTRKQGRKGSPRFWSVHKIILYILCEIVCGLGLCGHRLRNACKLRFYDMPRLSHTGPTFTAISRYKMSRRKRFHPYRRAHNWKSECRMTIDNNNMYIL